MNNDVYVVVLDDGLDTKVISVFSKYDDAENYILTKWTDHFEYGLNKVILPTELEFRVIDVANSVASMTNQVFYIKRREFNP